MFKKVDLAVLGAAQFFIDTTYNWFGVSKYFLAGTIWFFGLGVLLLVFWKLDGGIFSVGELLAGTVGLSLWWLVQFLIGREMASILKRGENRDSEVLDYSYVLVLEACANARCLWFFLSLSVISIGSSFFYISPTYMVAIVLAGIGQIWCSFIFYIFSCPIPPRRKSKFEKFLELLKSTAIPVAKPVPVPVPI